MFQKWFKWRKCKDENQFLKIIKRKGRSQLSGEVKMVYADVEEQLGVIENATTSLNPTAEPAIEGNTLDVVTKLNELALELDRILTSYQTVLLKNIETTRNSVQYMREQDQRISTNISGAATGPRRLMY